MFCIRSFKLSIEVTRIHQLSGSTFVVAGNHSSPPYGCGKAARVVRLVAGKHTQIVHSSQGSIVLESSGQWSWLVEWPVEMRETNIPQRGSGPGEKANIRLVQSMSQKTKCELRRQSVDQEDGPIMVMVCHGDGRAYTVSCSLAEAIT
jgi:hypothetical protein